MKDPFMLLVRMFNAGSLIALNLLYARERMIKRFKTISQKSNDFPALVLGGGEDFRIFNAEGIGFTHNFMKINGLSAVDVFPQGGLHLSTHSTDEIGS